MKKRLLTLILTITAMLTAVFGFTACSKVEFKVNFVVDGAVYSTINTNGQEIIKMPENPTKEGFTFDGWYWDKDTWQTPFTANSLLDAPLSSDMNVYCKWKAEVVNVESVSLNKQEITLFENDVDYLTATVLPQNATNSAVIWQSSNPTIATVVGGKVTALRVGNAIITATTEDGGKIATCSIYVMPILVESVTLNYNELNLLYGETKTLTATVLPQNATEKGVIWSSSNSSIITVENGSLTAVGYGTAVITVTTLDGNKTATCTVNVIEDTITFKTLNVQGETVYGKVSNTTTTFSFIKEIQELGNATYKVYKEITCETEINSKSISLNVGDNTVYILQTVGKNLTLYTVTVRRKPMYEVSFVTDINDISVETQVIEEDSFALMPNDLERDGYTFNGWSYNFNEPIIKNETVNALWIANTNTPYTVEYYLENLEDDKYTKVEVVTEYGTTDTLGYANIKTFEYFTPEASEVSGNINGDGKQVLKVYYQRNEYTLKLSALNNKGVVNGLTNGNYKYEAEITLTLSLNDGYTFDGWYNGEALLNVNANYTFTVDKDLNIVGKWHANINTPYTVEYYLENLEDDKYTKVEVVTEYGTTDTVGYANIKTFEYFTPEASEVSGNINGDGKQVLKVYYQRNEYTVTANLTNSGIIEGIGTYKYGTQLTLIAANINLGYSVGWYNEEELLSTNLEYNVVLDQNIIAKNYILPEMTNFNFTSTLTTCSIDSIKDKSVTEIIVPNYVNSINKGVFNGCSKLKSITLPFIGAELNGTSNTHFGYVFGASDYSYNDDNVPTSLKEVVITGSTSIGDYAFGDCDSLTSVTIGNGVISIGERAFSYCDSLTSVTIGNGVISIGERAFYNCTKLTSVTIGDSVTSIGEYAFYSCNSLTSVTIPNSVTYIGEYAFYSCSKLTKVNYLGTIDEWVQIEFALASSNPLCYAKNLYINNELVAEVNITTATKINDYAFYNCNSLTSVTIGDSVTYIGECAFSGCSQLTSVTIPDSVTSIDYDAFYNCNSLTNINVDENNTNYKSIDGNLYSKYGTTLIQYAIGKTQTSFTIPDSVTSIGKGAFNGCSKLESITLHFIGAELNGTSNTHFGYIFGASSYSYNDDYVPTSLKEVIITGGTSIGERAFYGCNSLTSITIPDSVTSIGYSAFEYCHSLTSVTIGNGVTSIGYYAFNSCSKLTKVNYLGSIDSWAQIELNNYYSNPLYYAKNLYINNELATEATITSATKINAYAFYNCNSLTSVTIPNSVTSIGEDAFYGCYKLVEAYNKSNLNITKGSSNYGYVGYYALNVYTQAGGSKLTTDSNGYVIYNDGTDKILVAYVGTETNLTLPNDITKIYDWAFYYCTSLTSVEIPDSVTSIGGRAFGDCDSLTSVTIGNSVTSIGYYAFGDCDSLTSVTIGNGVTSMGDYAFYGCNSLTSVTIGDGVTSIGSYAFSSCDSLTSVTIPNSVTSIGSSAFHGCDSLISVTIGDSVTSIGNYAFAYCDSLTSIEIPDSVTSIGDWAFYNCNSLTSVTIGDSVTSIGSSAFYDCRSLTSVEIPDSVTSIGSSAFSGCSSLEYNVEDNLKYLGNKSNKYLYLAGVTSTNFTSVTINENCKIIGYRAFYYCTSLTSVEIPDSVTSIGSSAFSDCYSLTSVTIGDSVTSIGGAAFYHCDSLTSVTIPNSVTIIGDEAFRSCDSLTSVTIGDSVTSIGKYAFAYCDSLTSVTIGDSVTSIGGAAFYDCTSLTSIEIPDSVTSIGSSAFYDCYSLTSVTIGDGVTSIGYGAFYRCDSLTSVTIPNSVTSIGDEAFRSCYSLTSMTIGDSVTSIGSYAFYGCSKLTKINYLGTIDEWVQIEFFDNASNPLFYAKKLYINNELVTEVAITSATKISDYAFYYCNSLTSVTIGDSVTSIGERAFSSCDSLTSVTIGNGVTSIGDYAFTGCDSLTSVTIGNGVTSIGDYAFSDCDSLTSVVIGNGVTSIGKYAFAYCDSLTNVVIGDSVTSIGYYALYGCSKLKSITLPFIGAELNGTSNTHFGYIFGASDNSYNDDYVPTSLKEVVITGGTSIGSYAFYGCDSLISVTIPNSVTSIGDYAFRGCTSLTSIEIPDSVTNIGSSAFYYCYSLTSVTIGDSVTSIGDYAFYYCTKLTSIEIPDSVTSIDEDAFRGCSSLTKVNYLGAIDEWVQIEFGNSFSNPLYSANNLYLNNELVTEVTIASATKINDYAFYNCRSLTSVTIGNGVTSIGYYAFHYCSLTSIEMPDSVTSIGNHAFYNCTRLTSIKYCGTESQWQAISKGFNWNNNTGSYTITYNYTGN